MNRVSFCTTLISSLCMRGTYELRPLRPTPSRFIPAYAGNILIPFSLNLLKIQILKSSTDLFNLQNFQRAHLRDLLLRAGKPTHCARFLGKNASFGSPIDMPSRTIFAQAKASDLAS